MDATKRLQLLTPFQLGRPLYVWSLKTVGPYVKDLNDLPPERRHERM